MIVNEEQRALLKKHGFMWFRDNSTDKVDPSHIQDVIPAANGFTVVYTEKSVFECSTAEVENIVFPDNLESEWTRVVWTNIYDQHRKDPEA